MGNVRNQMRFAGRAGLHGIWWIAAAASFIATLISHGLGIGVYEKACEEIRCASFLMLNTNQLTDLASVGISPDLYGSLTVILLAMQNISAWAVGFLLYRYGWKDPYCVVASLMLIVTGTIFSADEALVALSDRFRFLADWFFALNVIGSTYIFFLFLLPTGRFVPRWTVIPATIWIFEIVIGMLPLPPIFQYVNVLHLPPALLMVYTTVMHLLVMYVQWHRYRNFATPEQKRQIRWFWGAMSCYFVAGALGALESPVTNGIMKLFDMVLLYSGLLFLPFSIGMIVLEIRVRHMSSAFNRTLVYFVLSVMSVTLYALLVGVLGFFLQGKMPTMIALIATGSVAAMFQPLREKVQRAVNHLVFGERDEPYQVLSDLTKRIEVSLTQQDLLPTIVEMAARALRAPYAAIETRHDGDEVRTLTSFGTPVEQRSTIVLDVKGEAVGQLVVGIDRVNEALPPSQRHMLNDLVRQISIAVQTIRLTEELHLSRERVILTREEERRRVRRDLHDGLGSTLASIMLRLDEAIQQEGCLPDSSRKALETAQSLARKAITDIRQLVYSLRPPALDEFGLTFALKELALQFKDPSLQVVLEGFDRRLTLSAAAEVAVYRIVQEALTNVVKHAGASRCEIVLRLQASVLHLDISDNGKGLPETLSPGIGIRSIRERAAELGGTCELQSSSGQGTHISVKLPMEERRLLYDGERQRKAADSARG
ncbi:sensor histidine kinase [Cohnella ginsengisoli]|uniref:Oxygen sensor histidine kinase NreB n=1 Tax=Cohnella ginsengisoli TaxID=425004 RepID=A0A9X4KN28_9BACL|nr:sensor histidine kinase [Cohnella ginsengisoli]MDG0795143.1 sensor histidine kinase [Cohnella ginsengisoli]